MLIVYKPETGEIEYIAMTKGKKKGQAHQPTCANACKYHSEGHSCEECSNCFTVDDDKKIWKNRHKYLVNEKRELVKQPDFIIRIVPPSYSKKVNNGSKKKREFTVQKNATHELTIKFMDENKNPLFPVGSLLITTSRGNLDVAELNLSGDISKTKVNWTAPNENCGVRIKVIFNDEDNNVEIGRIWFSLVN